MVLSRGLRHGPALTDLLIDYMKEVEEYNPSGRYPVKASSRSSTYRTLQ